MMSGNSFVRLSVATFLLVCCGAGAEEAPLPPERWWTRSSLMQQDQSGDFQIHGELGMGGEQLDGNESGFSIQGRGLLALRMKPTTYYLDGYIDDQDKDYGILGSIKQRSYMVRNTLRYDIWREVFASVGVMWEQDDPRFVKERRGTFAGLGSRVDLTKSIYVTGYGAFGEDSVQYNPQAAEDFGVEDDSEESTGFLFSETCRWQATPTLAFEQNAIYVIYDEEEMEDRWTVGGSADIDLIRAVSLVLRYEVDRESNPLLEAVGGDEINNTFNFVVRVNF